MHSSLTISVRTLVEYVFRSGDLMTEFTGAARSLKGIRGHQIVQRSRPDHYTSEVAVSHTVETGAVPLTISGRIDGVYSSSEGVIIDEIKTTSRDPDRFSEREKPIHWAQAKTYAYMIGAEKGLDVVEVQLTYYQLGTGKIREFRKQFHIGDLKTFFENLVDRYLKWAETVADWQRVRNDSIRELDFPFPSYRSGQREMAVKVYRAIQDAKQLIVQAATGIGKTMAVIFPGVKALAEEKCIKIFYLTARTTGRKAAELAVDELRSSGLRLKSLTLTAKDKICFHPDRSCHPDECEFAKGHYDRIGHALESAFGNDRITRSAIEKLARDHRVCPFEFSLELTLWADCIICDYNYAFDPRVYLRRFFLEDARHDAYAFLIDEAHNLVDRARDMFSADITKQPFLDMRRAVKNDLPGLYRIMGKINSHLVKIRKECENVGGELTTRDLPEGLLPQLRQFLKIADRWLALNVDAFFRGELLELYFSVVSFVRVSEHFDTSYAVCCTRAGKDLRVRLFCMDPSSQMGEALHRSRSAVFFSATLKPVDYFIRILGCDTDARHFTLPSPFPPRNLGIFIADRISTLYRQRDETAPEVAKILTSFVAVRKGNYMFYFPSYRYLQTILTGFEDGNLSSCRLVVQTPDMSEPERDDFIANFSNDPTETLIGFAVMGGIFGEGIDLVGDRLTGAAIVGVGLPGISPERTLIKDHFAAVNRSGFEFAYLFPGMTRVLQAVGRVIRSDSDRGAVLLIDRRYGTRPYRSLLPPEWRPVSVRKPSELERELKDFWIR